MNPHTHTNGACESSSRTHPLFSTAFFAYSTWKMRPSGENVPADKSYCTHKRPK